MDLVAAPHLAAIGAVNSRSSYPQLAPEAKRTFDAAFKELESIVRSTSIDDYHEFRATSLADVREAARTIERQMAARQCLRSLRRLDIFLGGLEHYSKAIEVLCNGTSYLPWIWAPIKLTIIIASDHLSAFETLIAAYSSIAECLPRFDRLGDALKSEPAFQNILATYYSDILDFHRRAYIYVKRPAWKLLFRSCWGRFDARFKSTLESLSRHARLVDNEAQAWDILKSQEWRQSSKARAEKEDAERAQRHLVSSLSWLESGMDSHDRLDAQENVLSEHLSRRHSGSYEWIVKKDKFKAWHNAKRDQPVLWLKGKPGSGKSTLTATIAQFLRQNNPSVTLIYFCSYASTEEIPLPRILRSFATQILRQKPELSSYVNAEYIVKGLVPSIHTLRELLHHLLSALGSTSIVIDGIDECNESYHKNIVRELLSLASHESNNNIRLWIASRDTRFIQDMLHKKPAICLSEERDAVGAAINSFVSGRIAAMQDRFQDLAADDLVVSNVTNQIVKKAEGMFLWVRLVLDTLEEEVFSIHELNVAVQILPASLEEFYERILVRVTSLHKLNHKRALQILQWVAFAKRPVRVPEILNALAFTVEASSISQDTMLSKAILKLCSPLIELHADGAIHFVHFTVREYLVASLTRKPILDIADSEYTLCLSCISYLGFSAPLLVSSKIPSPAEADTHVHKVRMSVVRGMHGLHLYAQEYWIEHLLSYLNNRNLVNSSNHTDQILLERLDVLVQLFSATPSMQSFATSNHYLEVVESQSTRFLQDHPSTATIVEYRRKLIARQESDGAIIRDTSIFGEMLRAYHSHVIFPLGSNEVDGLSDEDRRCFREIYGPTAITCRFSGCLHATLGFPTGSLRNKHEDVHRPKILCQISDCTYGLAFSSVRALRKHDKEQHSEEVAIPSSIKLPRISTVSKFGATPTIVRKDKAAESFEDQRPFVVKSPTRTPSPILPSLTLPQEVYTAASPFLRTDASLADSSPPEKPAQSSTPSKAPDPRPHHPRIKCPHCADTFRGTVELDRHIARKHARTRKGFICIDASDDKKFLANCKHCRNQKIYAAYYNAAAHLRRAHFHPRKRSRKRKDDEKRFGAGGPNDPPMDYLRAKWIKEITVQNEFNDATNVNGLSTSTGSEMEIQNPDNPDANTSNSFQADAGSEFDGQIPYGPSMGMLEDSYQGHHDGGAGSGSVVNDIFDPVSWMLEPQLPTPDFPS